VTRRPPANLEASILARLLNLSRERGEEHRALLERFALEGLLRRLGISTYREKEVRRAEVDRIVIGGDVLPGPIPRESLARLFELGMKPVRSG
jgi:hypothetical protein